MRRHSRAGLPKERRRRRAACVMLLALAPPPAFACTERVPFIMSMAETAIAAADAARAGDSCAWQKDRAEDLAASALRELLIEGEGCRAEWDELHALLGKAGFAYDPNASRFELLATCER